MIKKLLKDILVTLNIYSLIFITMMLLAAITLPSCKTVDLDTTIEVEQCAIFLTEFTDSVPYDTCYCRKYIYSPHKIGPIIPEGGEYETTLEHCHDMIGYPREDTEKLYIYFQDIRRAINKKLKTTL